MNAAVGPLTTSPPTSGLTATTGAALPAIAVRSGSIARIGPIEITGLDGPITIARAFAIASSTSGWGARACSVDLDLLDRTLAAALIMNS